MTTSAQRIPDFDTWREGYAGSSVLIVRGGTLVPAAIFLDPAMTSRAANPQLLLTMQDGAGNSYGKFAQPIYCADAFQMVIDGANTTGVERPRIVTLQAEDATQAQTKSTRGTKLRTLGDRADRVVHALDFGDLVGPSATGASLGNTNTLSSAIGAASGQGGGTVKLPAGTFTFQSTLPALPANVVLEGEDRAATVLQCLDGANFFTIAGDRAGFRRLTLDGVQLQPGSQGVAGKAVNSIVFDDVLVQRFATGIHFKGSRRNRWRGFDIETCINGAQLHGDLDVNSGNDGDEFTDNVWQGRVRFCTGIGVELAFVSTYCRDNQLREVEFDSNTGTALRINGARNTLLTQPYFAGNTVDIEFLDGTDATKALFNTVIGFRSEGGLYVGGAMKFNGRCQNVQFDRADLSNLALQMTIPQNAVVLQDCTEDAGVTVSGAGTLLLRRSSNLVKSQTFGITTDASATMAWQYTLAPGQVISGRLVAIGSQQNGVNRAVLERSFRAKCAGSTLAYNSRGATAFTVGDVLTGLTSGAKARVTADAAGVNGTLTLRSIVGAFLPGEAIQDQHGAASIVTSALVPAAAAVTSSSTFGTDDVDGTAGAGSSGWAITFTVSGQVVQVNVAGIVGQTVEWNVMVDLTATS